MDKKALKHLETHNTEIYWNLKWLTALNLSSQPPGFDCGVQNLEMFSLQRNDSGEKVCFNMWQNINMCYKISALYGFIEFYWILYGFISASSVLKVDFSILVSSVWSVGLPGGRKGPRRESSRPSGTCGIQQKFQLGSLVKDITNKTYQSISKHYISHVSTCIPMSIYVTIWMDSF